MARIFISISDNHKYDRTSPSGRLLLRQRGDVVEVLEDGVSGGSIGELSYFIVELPREPASGLEYLKLPLTIHTPGSGTILLEKRINTVSISGLRDPMNPQDQRKFDRAIIIACIIGILTIVSDIIWNWCTWN